jgi:predicted dienelactone hydrolase
VLSVNRAAPLLFGVVTIAAACGGSSSTSSSPQTTTALPTVTTLRSATTSSVSAPDTTTASVATTAPASSAVAERRYAAKGPYDVGVVALNMKDRPVIVWYPAEAGSSAGKTQGHYDMRAFLPAADQSKVAATDATVFTMDAYKDVPAPNDDGPFPLVLFSHGLGGFATQSSFLTTHLASWGFVVVAPEHESRDLTAVLSDKVGQGQDDVADLKQAMSFVTDPANFTLASIVDTKRVAVIGHAEGGLAALKISSDAAVKTFVALAAGPDATPPTKPGLFAAGGADAVVPVATIESGVAALPPPRRLVVIGNATHLAFLDVCTLGRDKGGVLQIAKAAGVNVPDSLLSLYADGCAAKYLKPEDAWPLIDHVVTAQLRSAFGIDKAAVGLGPELSAAWAPIDVKVEDA